VQFLKEAKTFVESVMNHPDSRPLNKLGKEWWHEFLAALARLENTLMN
jgi:hypothetical protein